ncbi:MAG: CsbD family protein [Alphaproteobacteria bacterium]|nr:CsbD family protein [Alphaproteobacteria bacterium]
MNSDIIEGNWKQMVGEVQKRWGKFTNDQIAKVEGSRKKLSGMIQEQYGIGRDEAEKQVKEWEESRNRAA